MARPRKNLSKEQIEQVAKLAPVMKLEEIADFFGISDQTLRRRMHDDARVMEAYKRGKAQAIGAAGTSLLTLVRQNNLGAICFYLKTQARWRESDRLELTGADGGPIATQNTELNPDALREKLAGRLEGINQRLGDVRTAALLSRHGNGTNGTNGNGGNGAG